MPKLWEVNQCLLDPRPELESGTPQASSLGNCAPKIGVLSSLSPGSVRVLPGRNQETGVGPNSTVLG